MRKKLKKLSYTGLAIIGVVFVLAIVMALSAPKDAGAAAGLSGLMGLALFGVTAVTEDPSTRLRTLKYTHNAALNPGDPIVVNGSLIIAVNKTAANEANVFVYEGKVKLPKTAPLVISALDAVYWSAAASEVNKTSGGNTSCGWCHEAAASADTTVTIILVPNVAILDLAQSTQNVIADPGTGVAIPVTASGVVPITTAATETNTLAAPSFIGQILVLTCDVYAVGDRVITCATTVNQTGNNTMTFGAAGDTIVLYATQIGGALRWRVMSNDGVALSTV